MGRDSDIPRIDVELIGSGLGITDWDTDDGIGMDIVSSIASMGKPKFISQLLN